jgi:hypothetical protein
VKEALMRILESKHIDFIVNQKKQGKTYSQISELLGKKFGIDKSPNAIEHIYRANKSQYDLSSLKTQVEVKSEIIRSTILNEFLEIVRKRKHTPSSIEYHKVATHNRDAVSRQFGAFDGLVDHARENYPEAFEGIIDESAFTPENYSALKKLVAAHSRFVITTAVTGCEPHEGALAALKVFCKKNDAALLILPCSDPASTKEADSNWTLSHKLPIASVVFADLPLNSNLIISTIKTSAKQVLPTTGLRRLSQTQGSIIMASPKQSLEYSAKSNDKVIPRALMTTGAITVAEYQTDRYMSERTAYLAQHDHKLGAIIVEVKNDNIFFFRQIQFENKTGAFCDLNKKYHANGKIETITAELVQIPDYHVGSTDPDAKAAFKDLVALVKPDFMTLEDFFDGYSINPHERHNKVSLSNKARKGDLELRKELQENADEISELTTWKAKKLVFKYGNHEDFLLRWLNEGEFMEEPANKLIGMKLNIAVEENKVNPFEFAMRDMFGIENGDKVTFLGLEDSFVVCGIENGVHGHMGNSGRRNPGMKELEECYGAGNFGHNHSASIFREVFRVGTCTYYKIGYNKGPSKWTQTALVQHRNGTRQLINCIYGEYKLKD